MFPGFLPRVGRGFIFCRGFYLAEVEVGKKNRGFYPAEVEVKKKAEVEVKTRYTSRPRFYPDLPKNRGKKSG